MVGGAGRIAFKVVLWLPYACAHMCIHMHEHLYTRAHTAVDTWTCTYTENSVANETKAKISRAAPY